jgi:hypothetical protein
VAKLYEMSATVALGLGRLSVGFPIDELQCAVGPIVPNLHFFQECSSVDSVPNSSLKIPMDSLSINIKGHGSSGHHWDNRAILASLKTEIACIFVCFDAKLCEKIQFFGLCSVILMASNMFQSDANVGCPDCLHD